jgi:hypothetical protein
VDTSGLVGDAAAALLDDSSRVVLQAAGADVDSRVRGALLMQPIGPEDLAPLGLPALPGDGIVYVNGVIAALNWLYGARVVAARSGARRSAPQRATLQQLAVAAMRFHGRLNTVTAGNASAAPAWESREAAGRPPRVQLDSEQVDVPAAAGTCDPCGLVPRRTAALLRSAARLFPQPPAGLDRFVGFYAGVHQAYVGLTLRQLRAGLLELGPTCEGGGTILPAVKRGGRQRAVWHGARVSLAAARPPAPRLLANSSGLAALHLRPGRRIRLTKRDCRCWFDYD